MKKTILLFLIKSYRNKKEMFFILEISWFVDGLYGLSKKIHHKEGKDIVIFGGNEGDILFFAENLTEAWGQGGGSQCIVNFKDNKIDTVSNMESCYWGFDNVENFGLVDYEILEKYSVDEVKDKKMKDNFIYEAIIDKKFYQI